MREFFDRLNIRIAEFMQGRYGMDLLCKVMLIIGLVFLLVANFIPILTFVGWLFAILAIVRALSRNISARTRENEQFLNITLAPRKFFHRQNKKWANRKTTLYFKCKNCGQNLSVPKGKGKIRIICPKCGKEIFKTT